MQRTAKNITWSLKNVTWLGGLAFVLLLLGTMGSGCNVRDAAASAPESGLVSREAQLERGKYLVASLDCNGCHTPWKMGPNGPGPDMTRMLSGHPEGATIKEPAPMLEGPWKFGLVGSNTNTAFSGPWGVSFSANLTPDQNTGLGIWTEEMFIKALRTGKHYGVSRPILPPMPWPAFRNLTDDDLKAVFAYLRSIPPIKNRVPDPLLNPTFAETVN